MLSYVYIFQDVVSGAFGQPVFAANDDALKRDFQTIVDNPSVPDSVIKDTIVLCFGSFSHDKVNPFFDLYSVPRVAFRGSDFTRKVVDSDA